MDICYTCGMKTNVFNARHHGLVGPGGWRCTCCGPAPKHRKVFARLHKKRIYRALNRELSQENSNEGS